jgi:hypothetical protein
MFVTEKCVFKEKLRCDALDIQIRNLAHKQDLCKIQKNDKGIPFIDSKNTSLIGNFLWDMRSNPKM